jgi:hypothetical protein
MADVTMTPDVAARIREQLHTTVADTIDVRGKLEGAWTLLDAIGWGEDDPVPPINVAEHRDALLDAIAAIVPLLEEWLAETCASDPSQPARRAEIAALRRFKVELGA